MPDFLVPNPKTVLVVDDNVDLCDMISTWMELSGYRAIRAHRPSQALRFAESERPDIVLSDIAMPEMDGFRLCELLLSCSPAPKVVLMTAAPVDRRHRELAAFYGALSIHQKPLDLQLFVEVVAGL